MFYKYSHLFKGTDDELNQILNIYVQGVQKKSLGCDLEEKCLKKFWNIFWCSLYLYIFKSSQEVRAFYIM